ncbi:polysaccharide biosynthesis/export family protein [Maribacter sp. 2308TA10-17]|uniref:polysaccharide biosynthesis/export family protein n=1 Tax=Maribacter sp. 2308TA10-17 TaxID=3386276 RepID=UPI0039BD19DC
MKKYRYSGMSRVFLLLLVLSLSSCYTSKKLDYLQSNQNTLILPLPSKEQYKIQPSDVLSIKVQSRDPEQAAFFNITSIENRNFQANPASLFLSGYTVDPLGMINLAIVGELKVSDLTVEQIRDVVQLEIDKYLLNAIVTVQMTSFKISVLGDVKSPGTKYIYNTQATIFEALSAAGDLNISAKRKKIKVIRQVGNESVVVNLDLTRPSIIKSPYYFLHPNDVVYVETSKSGINQKNLGVWSLILSAITTTVLVLNFTTN